MHTFGSAFSDLLATVIVEINQVVLPFYLKRYLLPSTSLCA